jgi:RHS repeat-associated protein
VKEIATFGGASAPAWTGTSGIFTGAVTTDYNANFTTVTDQAGKVRRSMVDALGRLVRVDEPDGGNSPGSTNAPVQPTNYGYDVFGNLTTVTQSPQPARTFTYDSLSRLRTASNPESGTITYQYDDNSNLLVKTDAREVSTHFEYDGINRVTRRWYNKSTSLTASAHNNPALPSDVGPTDEVKFYYDSQVPQNAPTYTHGPSVGRLTAQIYGSSTNGDYYAYDALGRPTLKIQQTGTINYQLSADYSLSGALTTLTYPSGRTVTNSYDNAGRLSAFSGNLGDGLTRNYATGIIYSPVGGLVKEQFGTTTAIYNKLFYNSRGQLAEIRASTSYTGPTDYDANRGAIINSYSSQCSGVCAGSGMPDNNGNLKRQDITIPNVQTRSQNYDYDELNRLKRVHESTGNQQLDWQQEFDYDRWGNRTINAAGTWIGNSSNPPNLLLNETQFDTGGFASTNRLQAPGDLSLPENQRRMRYDAAGNLTTDTYTGAGNRTYDAENKITSAWGGQNQAQLYAYDASGQRIKRTVNGVQTWQVYGFGGELLAEYPGNGPAASPQKEYGYRNGQLLITAASGGSSQSLSVNGTSNYAEIPNSNSLNISGAITVEAWVKTSGTSYPQQDILIRHNWGVTGSGGGYELSMTPLNKARVDFYQTPTSYTTLVGNTALSTGVWHHLAGVYDASQMRIYVDGVLDGSVNNSGPALGNSVVRIGRNEQNGNQYFNGLIDEVRVSNAALYTSNFTPPTHLTASGSTAGLWKFDGQTLSDASGNNNNGTLVSGSYSTDVPAGPAYHSGLFNGTTAYVEMPNSNSLNISGAITVEAWVKTSGTSYAQQDILIRHNWGVSGSGGGYELSMTPLNKARVDFYQTPTTYTTLTGNTVLSLGVWHHIAGVYDGTQIRIYVDGVLDGSVTNSGPAAGNSGVRIGRNEQVGNYFFNGLIDEVRVSNAALYTSNFTPQTHLTASGSTAGLWKFDGQTTADASVNGNNGMLVGGALYSDDVPSGDGGGGGGTSSGSQVQWLIADHLGTPRMVFDKSGDLSKITRHDYLPFGEELFENIGGRSTGQGYASDGVRQQFTLKERDNETGLDYFLARYYASTQGRFTSADPANAIPIKRDPQSWNGYAHARNNPLLYIDPDGRLFRIRHADGTEEIVTDDQFNEIKNNPHNSELGVVVKGGKIYHTDENGNQVVAGTYERIWFDDLTAEANYVIWGIAARAPAMQKIIYAFAAANLLPAAGIVIADVAGGTAFYLAEQSFIRNLSTMSLEQVKAIYAGTQKELLSQLFGRGTEGARLALSSGTIPAGLTREALLAYAEVARRAIEAGKDTLGTQALRLEVIKQALERMK